MSDVKIKYLKHPVSAADKKKYREQGYKIIDARFAPEGATTATPVTSKAKGPTKDEIIDILTKAEVEFPANAKKSDLEEILNKHLEANGGGE